MSRRDEQLAELKANPVGVRLGELARVLRSFGFVERPGKGSHTVFKHRGAGIHLSIPTRGGSAVDPVYVRKAIAAIEDTHGRD